MALDAGSGQLTWRSSEPYTRELMPSTLAVSAGRVYFENADAVVCLDAATGQLRWQAPRPVHRQRLAWSTPTLVVHDNVVYSADRGAPDKEGEVFWLPSGGYHQYLQREDAKGELIAFNGDTGKRLWSCPAYEGFNAPVDLLIAGGLLWTGRFTWGNDPGITEGRDPKTGEVRQTRPRDQEFMRGIGHARCHRVKATEKFLIMGRKGVEFIDLATGHMVADAWVRGICQYGVMPANGLLYVPPHSCACNVNELLKCGFMALAPETKAESGEPRAEELPRLQRGPAYEEETLHPSSFIPHPSQDWPTYRHDPARSGALPNDVSHDLRVAWETELGGQLTSPVIAGGVLLVAESDAHRVHALDAATGRRLWRYVAGSRIDSPPTIWQGRVLFGSADGWVYCLRLADGKAIWRSRAALQDRQIVADGQLESAWPVSGSVLVVEGAAFFVAGRSGYLDGGMVLYKLDAASGRTLRVLALEGQQEKRKKGIASAGYLPDVLSALGDSIFMRGARFDRELARQKDDVAHLWSSVGFLDDSWWHRTYWQLGTFMGSGWGNWPKAGQQVPAGRLLVTDGSRIFGFGRNQYDIPGAHVGVDAAEVWGPIGKNQGRWTFYRLFGQILGTRPAGSSRRSPDSPTGNRPDWTCRIPVLVRAMVLAGQTLFVAGPADEANEVPHSPAAVDPLSRSLEAIRGGRLLAVSTTDGKTLADHKLPSPPVFDGMAAAGGSLYMTTTAGKVLSFREDR
jgi:outer membrane protein assembly factor BamB